LLGRHQNRSPEFDRLGIIKRCSRDLNSYVAREVLLAKPRKELFSEHGYGDARVREFDLRVPNAVRVKEGVKAGAYPNGKGLGQWGKTQQ
jgi:hypothetical protein